MSCNCSCCCDCYELRTWTEWRRLGFTVKLHQRASEFRSGVALFGRHQVKIWWKMLNDGTWVRHYLGDDDDHKAHSCTDCDERK